MFPFYQIHLTSINKTDGGPSPKDGVINKVSETTRSISVHHRSHLSLGAKLLHKLHPKVPPQGIISLFLVFLSSLGILAILSAIARQQLYLVRHQPIMQASREGIPNASNQNLIGTSKGANNAQHPSLVFPREQMIYHLAHYMALPHHLWTVIQKS
jgi:hypothetical protein